MTAVPADTPLTTPADDTVAIAVLLLFQVPPDTLDIRVVVLPTHVVNTPVMGSLSEFTVTTIVAVAVPQLFVTV